MGSEEEASDAASLDDWPDVSDEEEEEGATSVAPPVESASKKDGNEGETYGETLRTSEEKTNEEVNEDPTQGEIDVEGKRRGAREDDPELEAPEARNLEQPQDQPAIVKDSQQVSVVEKCPEMPGDASRKPADVHSEDQEGGDMTVPPGERKEELFPEDSVSVEKEILQECAERSLSQAKGAGVEDYKLDFGEQTSGQGLESLPEIARVPSAAEQDTNKKQDPTLNILSSSSNDEGESQASSSKGSREAQADTLKDADARDTSSVAEGEQQSVAARYVVEGPQSTDTEPQPPHEFNAFDVGETSGLDADDVWDDDASEEEDGWAKLEDEEIQATTTQEKQSWEGWSAYSSGLANSLASVATGVGGALREVGQGMVEDITAVASSTKESAGDFPPAIDQISEEEANDNQGSHSAEIREEEKKISNIFDRLNLQDSSESDDLEKKFEHFSHNMSSKFSSVWSWGGGALKSAASSFSSEVKAGLAEFQGAAKLAGSSSASRAAGEGIHDVSRAVSEQSQETLGYVSTRTSEFLHQQDRYTPGQSASLRFFDEFFQVSGGERAMEDVESISHACTLKCNKARATMPSKSKHDACLQKLQDILNLGLDEEIEFSSEKSVQFPGNGLQLVLQCRTEAQQEARARVEDAGTLCAAGQASGGRRVFERSEEQALLLDLKISGVEQLSEVLMLSMKRLLSVSKDIQQRDLVDFPEEDVLDVACALRKECVSMSDAIDQVAGAYSSALAESRKLFHLSAEKRIHSTGHLSEEEEDSSDGDFDAFTAALERFAEDMIAELLQDSRTCRSYLQDVVLHLTYVVLYTTVPVS